MISMSRHYNFWFWCSIFFCVSATLLFCFFVVVCFPNKMFLLVWMIKPTSTYVENFKWICWVCRQPEWSVLLILSIHCATILLSIHSHFCCISFASFSKFCHSLLVFKNAVTSCLWFLALFSVLAWRNKTWKWLTFFVVPQIVFSGHPCILSLFISEMWLFSTNFGFEDWKRILHDNTFYWIVSLPHLELHLCSSLGQWFQWWLWQYSS